MQQQSSSAGAFPSWGERGRGYLNTASYGLPPQAAVTAAQVWIDEWQVGSAPLTNWLPATDDARAAFARLVGVATDDVAIGTSVSQLVGLVAASLPDNSLVVAEEGEFTSLLFPFLAQTDRGVRVELVPRERLLEVASQRGDLVAFSLVGSADGERRDALGLAAAAAARGAMTIVDAAQAIGWLDMDYGLFDFVVCPAFKWLCSPRGTAFLVVKRRHLEWIRPSAAGWWASYPRTQLFGGPFRVASSARRLDVSPVWNSWAATAEALNVIETMGVASIAERAIRMANRIRAELDQPEFDSPIVIVGASDGSDRLLACELVVSAVPGGARLAFHAYNTDADVDRVLEVLHGH
jgi:selenocysteine lyase/cysteine desulfurase